MNTQYVVGLDYSTHTLTPDDVRAMRRNDYFTGVNSAIDAIWSNDGLTPETKRNQVIAINSKLAPPIAFDLDYALIARANAIKHGDTRTALLWDKEISILKKEI